jgi:hypothetical protein
MATARRSPGADIAAHHEAVQRQTTLRMLAYNLTRVLNIVSIKPLIAATGA